MKNDRIKTPSEFYRVIRPEYFSDSEIIQDVPLPKEHLAYELSQITTNQKQDEFETLCRKLAEKLIAPNLIPQVGPTGGGDGKTDSETYTVSSTISNRWFVPENGWDKDEKWAFAISAKQDWKTKAKDDIESIIGTKREYTKIYFITNQTPSSKKKKDAQDKFIEKYGLDIIILDGIWILDKVYTNNLIDLVVDSLNLSNVYKISRTITGTNDAYHNKKLIELEENISNPNRYSEQDFQLVEDALEVAILSRKLEKPRDEVEGKFDRAFRFCKKLNIRKQWIRLYYQRAWTYLYYYNDYLSFIEQYIEFKKYLSEKSSIYEIELYYNLYNSLITLLPHFDLSRAGIHLDKEREHLFSSFSQIEKNETKLNSTLVAKMFKAILNILKCIGNETSPDEYIIQLKDHFSNITGFIDFPFEKMRDIIEVYGASLPNNKELDTLFDILASISEQRSSELSAGKTFLRRGLQKYKAELYKESIVYFGKSILKLAKEESTDGFYYTLRMLSSAYHSLGLLWASNNCLVTASVISFKTWYEKGILDKKTYECVKQLAINEQFIGRLPSFLSWHELFQVISRHIDIFDDNEEISINQLMDACLSVRLLNSEYFGDDLFSQLPDLLDNKELWLTQNACLYMLGYTDLILQDYKGIDINNNQDLALYFEKAANQPFREQMVYDTNLLSGDKICISAKILGCVFNVSFQKDIELLLAAEAILAFFESFLATTLTDIYPSIEVINIEVIRNTGEKMISYSEKEASYDYKLEINNFNFPNEQRNKIWELMLEFTSRILANNFFLKNPEETLKNLFEDEQVRERTTFFFDHRNFVIDILGEKPKLFLDNWIEHKNFKDYPMTRATPLSFRQEEHTVSEEKDEKRNLNKVSHNKRKVISIIDNSLWDKASWKGFGCFHDPNYHIMGIFIGFENESAGKKIFNNWIKRFGTEDQEEVIKITIIKGIDKAHPFWYRVHIGSDINIELFGDSDLVFSPARFHTMNAESPSNLDNLLNLYNHLKYFYLCPARINRNLSNTEFYTEHSILKKELRVRHAWEIGLNELESVAIFENDNPIIPNDVSDAPVLDILRGRKKR